MQVIPKNTISFLKQLKLNNNRDWFNENKEQFKSIQTDIKIFAQEVNDSLNVSDDIEKLKIENNPNVKASHDEHGKQLK